MKKATHTVISTVYQYTIWGGGYTPHISTGGTRLVKSNYTSITNEYNSYRGIYYNSGIGQLIIQILAK